MIEDKNNNTKRKILKASLELFSKNGFSATSVRQICKEAGFRESVIYNHFNGKYHILKTLFLMEANYVQKELLKKIDDEKIQQDPKGVLKSIAQRIMIYSNNQKRARFLKIIMMEMFRDPCAKQIIKKEIFENRKCLMKNIFLKLQKMGMIQSKDPMLLTQVFLGPLTFYNLEHLLLNDEEEKDIQTYDLIQQHIDFFWEKIKLD